MVNSLSIRFWKFALFGKKIEIHSDISIVRFFFFFFFSFRKNDRNVVLSYFCDFSSVVQCFVLLSLNCPISSLAFSIFSKYVEIFEIPRKPFFFFSDLQEKLYHAGYCLRMMVKYVELNKK